MKEEAEQQKLKREVEREEERAHGVMEKVQINVTVEVRYRVYFIRRGMEIKEKGGRGEGRGG